jgi:hypothetical protein
MTKSIVVSFVKESNVVGFWFTGKIYCSNTNGNSIKGVSRSASFVIAYLMREKHMNYFKALCHVR